ncbi:hypothetical protein [Lactobacillus amylovorus]|uniref:hypothetical protein n=1 Tax=Lactobacillus amylovorus TaxID=1604 RepID=UPI00201E10D7|nr:hypothetical protein [Lactobacillus amylovorus]
MNDFWIDLIIKLLGLILGYAGVVLVGYFTKHHIVIRTKDQQIDLTQEIRETINQLAKWGVLKAKTHDDWTGEQKTAYVVNLIKDGLSAFPIPVKDVEKYMPYIQAAVEAAYQGMKVAESDEKTADQELPQAEKPDADLEPIIDENTNKIDSRANQNQANLEQSGVQNVHA